MRGVGGGKGRLVCEIWLKELEEICQMENVSRRVPCCPQLSKGPGLPGKTKDTRLNLNFR